MTRQKKELLRAIQQIDEFIDVDTELGCGFSPADAFRQCSTESLRVRNAQNSLKGTDAQHHPPSLRPLVEGEQSISRTLPIYFDE